MKQQGSLIKKLRTDRKISQAMLAEGISSRTTLSSFENRKTNLSSQTLFDYLDKMNITVHEFSLLLDSEATDQKRQLVQDFYTRYYDRTLTLDYLTSLEERYFETQNFFYYSLYIQGLLLLNRESFLKNQQAYSKEVELVKQYLFDIETWGRFELNLFSNLLFIFDQETISYYLDHGIKKILRYANDPFYANLLSVVILNGCAFASENKDSYLLNKFLLLSHPLPNTPLYFYLKIHQVLYQEIYSYLQSSQLNKEVLRNSLIVIEQAGYQNHKNDLQNLIRAITNITF